MGASLATPGEMQRERAVQKRCTVHCCVVRQFLCDKKTRSAGRFARAYCDRRTRVIGTGHKTGFRRVVKKRLTSHLVTKKKQGVGGAWFYELHPERGGEGAERRQCLGRKLTIRRREDGGEKVF